MAKRHSIIPPFPDHIDRDYFGAWLSGFVDGEGHFGLIYCNKKLSPLCTFEIRLRADDVEVLKLIQSFLQCGRIHYQEKCYAKGDKPKALFKATRYKDLKVIAAHFKKYPLIAKKSRDFAIWDKAVEFCCGVNARRHRSNGRRGACAVWTDSDRQYFASLMEVLRSQRKYENRDTKLDPPPNGHEPPSETQQSLF